MYLFSFGDNIGGIPTNKGFICKVISLEDFINLVISIIIYYLFF